MDFSNSYENSLNFFCETYIFRSLLNKGFLPVTTEADGIELFCRIPSCRLSWDGGCWLEPNPPWNPLPTAELKLETAETGPGPVPGGPTFNDEDPTEVGVIRPPPTAELKPMVPGFATWELGEAEGMAARDNCASEEPDRFKFCNEPIPIRKDQIYLKVPLDGVYTINL